MRIILIFGNNGYKKFNRCYSYFSIPNVKKFIFCHWKLGQKIISKWLQTSCTTSLITLLQHLIKKKEKEKYVLFPNNYYGI